jgi:hypothetical protein
MPRGRPRKDVSAAQPKPPKPQVVAVPIPADRPSRKRKKLKSYSEEVWVKSTSEDGGDSLINSFMLSLVIRISYLVFLFF